MIFFGNLGYFHNVPSRRVSWPPRCCLASAPGQSPRRCCELPAPDPRARRFAPRGRGTGCRADRQPGRPDRRSCAGPRWRCCRCSPGRGSRTRCSRRSRSASRWSPTASGVEGVVGARAGEHYLLAEGADELAAGAAEPCSSTPARGAASPGRVAPGPGRGQPTRGTTRPPGPVRDVRRLTCTFAPDLGPARLRPLRAGPLARAPAMNYPLDCIPRRHADSARRVAAGGCGASWGRSRSASCSPTTPKLGVAAAIGACYAPIARS